MMDLEKRLKDAQVLAVVCNQWGDTGKGKFSDYFADRWADVIARGTGGNNAGHTVVINGVERIFHLIPAGIVYDRIGKVNILGNGMVIDLNVLCRELDELDREGISYNNLMISRDAHIIMPYHISRDRKRNQSQSNGGVGSTGRGIGPCYADKTARRGIKVSDLLDKNRLYEKIRCALRSYSDEDVSIDDVMGSIEPLVYRIKGFIRDTISETHRFLREGRKICIEGAQGLLLSVEYGTYPYVTSSDCSVNGTAAGIGISARAVDITLGVVKFPFMTRVGGGPFPTEIGGSKSEIYCSDPNINMQTELERWDIDHTVGDDGRIVYDPHDKKILSMVNSHDPFTRGIGIRLAAGEYGATTGRPRRIGYTDAVAARYAAGINGPLMILTKADALADAERFGIVYSYINGSGRQTEEFNRDPTALRSAAPNIKYYEGYPKIGNERKYDHLPAVLRKAIEEFESFTGGHAAIISVGAERDATIIR